MKRWDNHPEPRAGLCYTARVPVHEIGFLVSLVEGHEGLAIVRTKDETLAIVEFSISPLMQSDFESLLSELTRELGMTVAQPISMSVAALESEV